MQRNHCSSVVLLGAVLALLAACGGKKEETSALAAATPGSTNATAECVPADVQKDLVGPTWAVDQVWCDGCLHTHLEETDSFTFTKSGANFDVHGSYETSGGALEANPKYKNEVRGKVPTTHAGGGEPEHWFAAHLYVEDQKRCGKPAPYDLKIAVCKDMPESYDACMGDEQHGGYAHSHP
jgi:hypothetical protein